eukprot:1107137-Pyramimonas_sp.AAC.1
MSVSLGIWAEFATQGRCELLPAGPQRPRFVYRLALGVDHPDLAPVEVHLLHAQLTKELCQLREVLPAMAVTWPLE